MDKPTLDDALLQAIADRIGVDSVPRESVFGVAIQATIDVLWSDRK